MKKLFSILSRLSAKRFAELHSDWPKLFLGAMPLLEVTEIQMRFTLYFNGMPIR